MQWVLVSFADVSVAASGITSGRAQSLVATLVALTSVVIGGSALARSARDLGTGQARSRAFVALAIGLFGIAFAGLRLATATGAIGTGSGRLGAIVALVVAVIGTILGGLALSRRDGHRARDGRDECAQVGRLNRCPPDDDGTDFDT